jgi:hypothetical protein
MKRSAFLLVATLLILISLKHGVKGAEIAPIYSSPLPNSTWVQTGTTITFRFVEDIEDSSLSDRIFEVTGTKSGNHTGKTIVARDRRTVIFTPDKPFLPAETIEVSISSGLRSTLGSRFYVDPFHFTTSPTTPELPIGNSFFNNEILTTSLEVTNRSSRIDSSERIYVTAPSDFPKISVTSPADGTENGYVFLSNFIIDFDDLSLAYSQPYLLILDDEGEPVFYRRLTTGTPAIDFKKQSNGLLTYIEWGRDYFSALDDSYNIVKTFSAGNGYRIDLHDLQILPNEHALLLIYDNQRIDISQIVPGGNPNAIVTGLVIQELDVDGNVVFQWRSWDHFDFSDSKADLTADVIDYVHGNAIELDFDGNLLLSSRAIDEITKIDRQTGEIIWRLGGKKNEFTFIGDPDPFFSQHDIRRLPNGNITLFDNRSQRDDSTYTYSRAVEYELDEIGYVAKLVWEYRGDNLAHGMGNAQRLPNGNTMIGWGTANPALTEVKPNGDKALEMILAPLEDPSLLHISYRAFRSAWVGNPQTTPMLIAKNEAPGMTSLYYSWNGATEITAFEVYGGEEPDQLMLLETQEKTGFETHSLIADAQEKVCFFKVMPLDKQEQETRFSNLALAEHCIQGQVYFPIIR